MAIRLDRITKAAKLIFEEEHKAFRRSNPRWAATRAVKRWGWLTPTQKSVFKAIARARA